MVWGVNEERSEPVVFTGTRRELGGILTRGYGLMVPTIGLYRFWLTTWKRRFYWSHTEIGGDSLEYTGNAQQLLFGFMMAVVIFLPLYGLFFYLSTLSSDVAMFGYGGVGVLLWFLMGYAAYRARDFRLSRTLWRGIRLDQGGNAWGYGLRRFGWSLAMVATAGLIYPVMAANLWHYRYSNSWFGDRKFSFVGSWKQIAAPYYQSYVLAVIIGSIGLSQSSFVGLTITDFWGLVPTLIAVLPIGLIVLFYQSRELSRMFSAVRLGQAALTVRVSVLGLLGPYIRFVLALVAAYALLAIGGFIVLRAVASDAFAGGTFSLAVLMQHMQGSLTTLAAIIFGYLLLLGAFSLMSELFLGLGYWKLIAGRASVRGLESLSDVRARAEDKALAGEGLADALNVGAY